MPFKKGRMDVVASEKHISVFFNRIVEDNAAQVLLAET